MTFQLFGIDFYWTDGLFGFWVGSLEVETETNQWHRSLFGIYNTDGELIVDLFWIRICTFYI